MEIVTGFGGVILGALLTLAREFWSEHRSRNKRASYLAIRVVGILERFIEGCTAVVSDHCYEDERGCIRPTKSCPNIEFESLDVDWESLPFDLMYEIINFPSHVEAADGVIDSVVEYVAGPPDYKEFFEERAFQYSKLGILAHELSTTIRGKYGMPEKNYEDWNPIEPLKNTKEKIDSLRLQADKRFQELRESHNKSMQPTANASAD